MMNDDWMDERLHTIWFIGVETIQNQKVAKKSFNADSRENGVLLIRVLFQVHEMFITGDWSSGGRTGCTRFRRFYSVFQRTQRHFTVKSEHTKL